MKLWIEKFQKEKAFIHSQQAIQLLQDEELPKHPNQKRLIPVLLMNRYYQGSAQERDRIICLLEEAGKKGYSFQGRTNRNEPVFFNIIRFRMRAVYPYLDVRSSDIFYQSINTLGYLGKLIKQGARVCERGEDIDSVLNDVDALFQSRAALEYLAKEEIHPSGLAFQKLIDAINQEGFPEFKDEQLHQSYQIALDPRTPRVSKYALHDATMYYNTPLVQKLLQRGANPLVKDFWGRTFLHIAEIIEADDIRAIADTLPENISSQLKEQRDGLGRTPAQIREWKARRNYIPSSRNIEENGGWDTEILEKYDSDKRDVDVVSYQDINFQRFSGQYMSSLKPLIIRGGSPQMKQLQEFWSKQNFKKRFADLPISTGDVPYAGTFGKEARRLQFKDYRGTQKEYAFSGVNPSEYPKLFQDFKYLGFFNKLANRQAQFYQGIKGTGAPVHSHTDAWNALVHGRKRWFVFPPLKGYYSTKPVLDWMENGYHHVQPLEFIQEAGDIAYIPRYWGHAVLNLQESVGVAVEFVNPYVI